MRENNNNQLKKKIGEFLHMFRFGILILLLILSIFITYSLSGMSSKSGIVVGIILFIGYALMVSSMFLKFETNHNFAQLEFGDATLEITFFPGDLIFVLPGFNIKEHKNKMLLDRNEMSATIDSKEVQFKGVKRAGSEKSRRDSVTAKTIRQNYYLDAFRIYHFLMLAPDDYEKSLMENATGDFGTSFKNRIPDLEQAQDFKDFQYFSQNDIDNDNKVPQYVKDANKPGMWILVDENVEDDELPEFCNEDKSKLFLPEFTTTIDRAEQYGIFLKNTTIGDFEDSTETDEARNEVRRQDFKNETKNSEAGNREKLFNKWYKKALKDESIINKSEFAANQVNMIYGDRKEIGTDGGAQILVKEEN